ncbi:ABC transporter permease subunit [Paenibacillus sp. HJL G12]|uniref:ABC transporter permease subunit n=1 Tax=Paenibacillus dendrobii TaxID=2691084 RepID=A0A7X3LIG8_9BACL|nr:ABC transporter permease [Paenibacillus dendrobii]MWV44543.1 ABC transporter permease subunit [Paenibacillus dendrobii]
MGNFFSLVQNENMKIYRRVRTWVMLGILVIVNLLIPILFSMVESGGQTTIWDSVILSSSFTFFLCTIFSVIIAADSVAGEFSWGTIKLLLIRPWSRSKILLSKYVSVVLFSLLCTLLLAGISILVSSLLFSGAAESGMLPFGKSGMAFTLQYLLCDYVNLFITVAIAFMLSTVFRAGGLAIGLALFMMFTKGIFTTLFSPERYVWAKYLIFTHMDLTNYLQSSEGPGGITLGFSLAVLAVYYIVFLAISWYVFSKRDVAA